MVILMVSDLKMIMEKMGLSNGVGVGGSAGDGEDRAGVDEGYVVTEDLIEDNKGRIG